MQLERIEANEAHLWYGRPEEISDPGLLRRLEGLLGEDERTRIGRYRFAKDRHVGLVTWGLLRCLLSRYAAIAPADWRFRSNPHGRPEIATPGHAAALRFNIAHTEGMIVVLVAEGREVGVDVESLPYEGPCLEIAHRYFSNSEVAALRSLPPSQRSLRFIELWTLKESFLKALGTGLSIPLDAVSFHLETGPGGAVDASFACPLEDNAGRWWFDLDTIGERHVVSTTVERRRGKGPRLRRRELAAAA